MFRVAAALEGALRVSDTTAARRLGDGDRARGALRAGHRHEAVLLVRQPLRRRAQRQHLPHLPRPARLAAGAQRRRGRDGHAARPGAAVRREALGVRPEELLLSGPGQGLPGLPVRPAHQRGRPPRPALRAARRHHARPHRGGHRQAHPRRRRRSHPRRRPQPRGLQPLRRAAGGDRVRARPPHQRAGQGVRRRAAGDPPRHRGERRQDGGGLDARRRQRLRQPRRRAVGHPLRDQEPQLAALARPGHRPRGAPPDRPARERRAGAPGDPPLGRGLRPHRHPPREGGRRRLPLLPRARPRAARPQRRRHRPHRRVAPAAARRPPRHAGRRRRSRADRRRGRDRGPARPRRPGRRRHRGGRRRRSGAHPRRAQPRRRGRRVARRPSTSPRSCTMETGGELTATQAKTVLAEVVATGKDPADDRQGEGLRGPRHRRARGDRRRGHRRPPQGVGGLPHRRRQGPRQAHRLLHGQGDAGQQGPGRRQDRHRPPPLEGGPASARSSSWADHRPPVLDCRRRRPCVLRVDVDATGGMEKHMAHRQRGPASGRATRRSASRTTRAITGSRSRSTADRDRRVRPATTIRRRLGRAMRPTARRDRRTSGGRPTPATGRGDAAQGRPRLVRRTVRP